MVIGQLAEAAAPGEGTDAETVGAGLWRSFHDEAPTVCQTLSLPSQGLS